MVEGALQLRSLDGEVEWCRRGGGSGYDQGSAVATSAALPDAVMVSGTYTGQDAAFGERMNKIVTNYGDIDLFVWKVRCIQATAISVRAGI